MLLFIFTILSMTLTAPAAPVPATSTSAIISSKPGLFLSKYGFQIHTENTNWKNINKNTKNKNILVEYRGLTKRDGVQPSLTVRVDENTPFRTLKKYMKNSLKEYSRFGFKTLKKKPFKVNNQLAYLVDLYSPTSQRQLRQVVFYRNKNAVILTCRAHKNSFNESVQPCNQIIKNFSWATIE